MTECQAVLFWHCNRKRPNLNSEMNPSLACEVLVFMNFLSNQFRKQMSIPVMDSIYTHQLFAKISQYWVLFSPCNMQMRVNLLFSGGKLNMPQATVNILKDLNSTYINCRKENKQVCLSNMHVLLKLSVKCFSSQMLVSL